MSLSQSQLRQITLSQQELCAISLAISRDFSPRFFRSRSGRSPQNQFSPQELREISRQICRDFAPSAISDKSRLVLLALAPRRLHVYWQIAGQRLRQSIKGSEIQPAQGDVPQLTLRIYPPPTVQPENPSAEQQPWIEIAVDNWQGQQDVRLPKAMINPDNPAQPMPYHAVLGQVGADQSFEALAYSNLAVPPSSGRPPQDSLLSPQLVPFIMSGSSSPSGKTTSGQGK